jgi:hypothetical protein
MFKITPNVQGLPQGWDCCCVRPATEADLELLLLKLTIKSQIEFG